MTYDRKNKILNYSIIVSLVILVTLIVISTFNGSLDGIMGDSVYKTNREVGEVVSYQNSNWYIISENDKSYTLLKETSLTSTEMGLGSNLVSYDYNNNCNEIDDTNCHSNLNEAYIGTVLNYYQNNYLNKNDLVTVDDYTIRLLNNDDYEVLKDSSFLYLDGFYWTMIEPNYSGINVYGLYNTGLNMQMVYDNNGLVRPVINVSKSVIK